MIILVQFFLLYIYLIPAQNTDRGHTLEPPHRLNEAVVMSTHNPRPEQKRKQKKKKQQQKNSFTINWGARGCTFHGHVCMMLKKKKRQN